PPLGTGAGGGQSSAVVPDGSFGQASLQSGTPSPSESVSATPQPQMPGEVLAGSFGQPSWQSGVPSPSESMSATPQPHSPRTVLWGSLGQPSRASLTPSPSASGPTVTKMPSEPSVNLAQNAIWSMLLKPRGPPLLEPMTVYKLSMVRVSPGATCIASPVCATRKRAPAASCAHSP